MPDPLIYQTERLVPAQTPWYQTQLIRDHLARYHFAANLVRGGLVVDAACGSGYGSALLAAKAKTVIGFDLDPAIIHYAQKQSPLLPNLTFKVADVTHLPLPPASVDLLVSLETIEHLHDQSAFIKSVRRCLKPRGLFILSTINPLVTGRSNPYHQHELTQTDLSQLLKTFSQVTFYGQKPFPKAYLNRILPLIHRIPAGRWHWLADTVLKLPFRGTGVTPLATYSSRLTPAFFLIVGRR
ncbi:hypothetical protein A2W24_04845 [Microgenomates group bacterium RBG_16_45_19]|nr:MAG: hypothetical protein A2W24_04845 [Microgenomates group bacterium RBG_16_45_19]